MEYTFTSDNFEEEVLKSDVPVLVDMFATWCGPCKMMKPILEKISETGIAVFEVDVEDQIELADKYKVQSIPTTIYFENGVQVSKTIGARPGSKILEEFNHENNETTSIKNN